MSRILLVFAAACGATAPTTTPTTVKRAPAVEPTFGICARDRTAGATTAEALLAASADARRRGCPREAALDAIAAAPGDGKTAALAQLAQLEAGEAAYTVPLVGTGEVTFAGGELPDEDWARTVFDPMKLDDTLEAIATATLRGVIPATERESGRIARVMLGPVPTLQCMPGGPRGKSNAELAKTVRGMQEMIDTTFGVVTKTADRIAQAELRAVRARKLCDIAGAAAAFEEAARLEEAAGRPAEALEARLSAWETAHVPGVYAGLLAISDGVPPEKDMVATVRGIEAAAQGTGDRYRDGMRAAAALDAIVRGRAIDPAAAARVAWLRAVVALRMLAKPADARRLAETAQQLAVTARRADILDAARMIGVFAATELGDADDVERLLVDVFASTKQRGTIAAREHLVLRFLAIDVELARRGRGPEELVLARALRRTTKGFPLYASYMLGDLLGSTLEGLGRIAESLEDRTALLAELGANPDRIDDRDTQLLGLEKQIAQLRVRLGDVDSIQAFAERGPAWMRPIARGFVAGDIRPLAAFLRTGSNLDHLAIAPLVCAARPAKLVAGMHEALDQYRTLRDNYAGTRDGKEAQDRLAATLLATSQALMTCGATTRNAAVFRAGRDVARELGVQGPHDDALAAEANGDAALAASLWARADRDAMSNVRAADTLHRSAEAATMLERAAAAYLRASPPNIEEALAMLEQGRSRDLRTSRSLRRASSVDPALAPLVAVESELLAARTRLHAIDALGEDRELARAREVATREVERLEKLREAKARALGTSDPVAYRAAALAPQLRLRDIQARLQTDEVLVYYVVKNLEGWAIVVDPHRASVVPLSVRDADELPGLEVELRGYDVLVRAAVGERGLVRRKGGPASAPATLPAMRAALYDRLVKPLEAAVPPGKRVLIVPDSATAGVAFAELGPAGKPWIERNPIRLLPGTYFLDTPRRDTLGPRGKAVVVGDPDYGAVVAPADMSWPRLPATRTEATEVARRLGATPLLDAGADEATVKKLLPAAQVIHLATHGQADVRDPSASRIVLASRAGEDGYLQAYEIERLRLQARLVVLSACETGKGQAAGTEGLLALDRAFLAAGASAVISSLWVVPDEPTAALMSKLYEELAAKRPADLALANAMAYVRSQPKWSDPLNWAAFRLVGGGLR